MACLIIFALFAFFNRNATIRPENPIPYIAAMFVLINNSYANVSENVYMTRSDDFDGLRNHMEDAYDVEFLERFGSAFFFASDEKRIATTREIYFGFNVFELTIIPMR